MLYQSLHQIGGAVTKEADRSTLAVCFMAALCALLPLDISQLSFAILGAALYALLYKSNPTSPKKKNKSVLTAVKSVPYKTDSRIASKSKSHVSHRANTSIEINLPQRPGAEVRQPSCQPVVAPSFQSQGWEAEVRELLVQIAPATEVETVVKKLVHTISHSIDKIAPEVEVTGFANGNLNVSKAFGVAVPEIEIVATVSPAVLFRSLHGRNSPQEVDAHKLQKSTLRACTDRLVSIGGFKFRRSAFRGNEPKVTLLVPPLLGLFVDSFPIDFSVNVVTPFYNAALLRECEQMDARAKELILLVRRWAKDRGICHSAKGHLSPYIWCLMCIYFLQVRDNDEEGSLLSPLEERDMSSGKIDQDVVGAVRFKSKLNKCTESPKTVGTLFKEFVDFFSSRFDWRKEAVSIRLGRRSPSISEPLHILHPGHANESQVGPAIEDPFQKGHNLGNCMTVASLTRLEEELSRASELCARNASLSDLLEPWAPSDMQDAEPCRDNSPQHSGDLSCTAQLPKTTEAEDGHRDEMEAHKSSVAKIPPWRRAKPA